MSQSMILRVAVPAPLHKLFDYLPPKDAGSDELAIGMRVRVPFGRGSCCGLIMQLADHTEYGREKLKRAEAVLDEQPLFSSDDLLFLEWAANYYQHPIGEVVANALPVRLRNGETAISLKQQGWSLTDAGAVIDPETLRRAPRQQQVMAYFQQYSGCQSKEAVFQACGESQPIVKALVEKGWIQACELEPQLQDQQSPHEITGPDLNSGQLEAVSRVEQAGGEFGVYLLDGVTGSGKTEVYLKLIEDMLTQGRQVLVLVPEIGLTPQLLRRFARRIPGHISLLHSGLAKGEREQAWHEARLGISRVVLGTRSALFTPMPELGLVIIDEEHDLSFKQQEGFRYSARDMAIVKGQRWNIPVVLGSATPSLESMGNAERGRYQHLKLPERAGGAVPPKLDLLDIRSVRLEAGVSPTLMRLIQEELAVGNQVLLFLNRRGYAPVVTCHDCGWISTCRRCDARMTLHMGNQLLWCHHCGSQRRLDHVCPECGKDDLRPLGQGTERLEAMLAQRLPDVAIARIDRDSTRRKGSLERLLKDIRQGKYSLLLGTQMLSKGHHFPDVTLVGILDVDQGLFGADYRAAERMAQQIIQVAGRAGRAEKPGRVVIQTRHPDHPLLQTLTRQGYDAFAREALQERREVGYPPYSYQALLRAEAVKESHPRQFLDDAVGLIGSTQGLEVWGPVPAPMERRAGRYRAHLLLQSTDRGRLHQVLTRWVPALNELPSARRVRWSLDIDPQETY